MVEVHLERLAHALAICGGSEDLNREKAWQLAQSLVCEGESRPCGICGACLRVLKRESEAVLEIASENETAPIKIESAHRIGQFLSLQKISRARVVIIDQAQRMNVQTVNALLKSVEEPPPDTYFILTTPESSQLLPTLRSRVQWIRLKPQDRSTETADPFREVALKFLNGCLAKQHQAVSEVLENAEDRRGAELTTHQMQRLLRDWCALDSADLLNPDIRAELNKWPSVSPFVRAKLWQSARRMEVDLHSHIDRSLVFENFFREAVHALD